MFFMWLIHTFFVELMWFIQLFTFVKILRKDPKFFFKFSMCFIIWLTFIHEIWANCILRQCDGTFTLELCYLRPGPSNFRQTSNELVNFINLKIAFLLSVLEKYQKISFSEFGWEWSSLLILSSYTCTSTCI